MNPRYQKKKIISCRKEGVVEQVLDLKTDRLCLLKKSPLNEPIYCHQLRTEMDILSALHHPMIPRLYDAFEEEGWFVLIEEWIDAEDLYDVFNHSSHLSLRKQIRWILEGLEQIEKLHSIGYLYIDIKNENFLVHHDHLSLIDFNSCLPIGNKHAYFASRSNQAPELLEPVKKTIASDVYSVGAWIDSFPNHRFFRPIVRKCMKKKMDQRYKDVVHVQMAIKRRYYLWKILRYMILLLTTCLLFFKIYAQNDPLMIYRLSKDPSDLVNAYTYTLHQKRGDYREKVQMNLYQWIEENWIPVSIWQDSAMVDYFLYQAILSQNPVYMEHFIQTIPKQSLEQARISLPLIQSYLKNDHPVSVAVLQEMLEKIDTDLVEESQKVQWLDCLVLTCLVQQVVLPVTLQDLLQKIIDSVSVEYLQTDPELAHNLAYNYLEYCLFLRMQHLSQCKFPEPWMKIFEFEEDFQGLVKIWRNVQ